MTASKERGRRELRQMRLEVAQAAADDLVAAMEGIRDTADSAAEGLAQTARQLRRQLRDLDGRRTQYLVEAVGDSGRPLAHIVVEAHDREDALAQGEPLLQPGPGRAYPEGYSLRARPCAPGELVYLSTQQEAR